MTLSQRGLSIRIGRSVSFIRSRGELVETTMVRDGLSWMPIAETWRRVEYANGRLSYYELVA